MAAIARVSLVTALGFALLSGCGQGSSPDAATSASVGASAGQSGTAAHPVARAASEWLDAVLKGDTQRASSRLTPQAVQRIAESGKQFSPPGVEDPSFQIGEVRTPSQDQAIVQCVLHYTAEGKRHSEEMCCLLKRVENDWRVSGIAYGTAPDRPWTLSDFETGQDVAIPRQTMPMAAAADSTDTAGAAGRPSPRTAQESPTTAPAEERRY